jgi:hypothetical protein
MAFTLKFKEEIVEIDNGDEDIKELAVRELSGRQREDYLAIVTKKGKRTAYGFEVVDYNGFTTALLERVLYWKDGDDYTKVTRKEIMDFPASLVEELTGIANDMNGFKTKAKTTDTEDDLEEAEGN